KEDGGESGIRTHGRVSPTHAFQACSFNHSDISPSLKSTTCERSATDYRTRLRFPIASSDLVGIQRIGHARRLCARELRQTPECAAITYGDLLCLWAESRAKRYVIFGAGHS